MITITLRRATPRANHRARGPMARLRLIPRPPAEVYHECGGEGYVKESTGWRLDDWIAVPCQCRRVPTVRPERRVA